MQTLGQLSKIRSRSNGGHGLNNISLGIQNISNHDDNYRIMRHDGLALTEDNYKEYFT